jgi:KaiC/GvpD/RAD55 family RecA-like ATPase
MTTQSRGSITKEALAKTGIEGLDSVLGGGLTPRRLYLVEGVPGSGKTTLALQFLLEGVRLGEPVLYVTLSETEEELRGVVQSHDWTLDGITVRELAASEDSLTPDDQYTMFHPSEVELSETTRTILADVERIKPTRVVFDSLAELRLLAGNPLRYRRQILALKQFFSGRNCTILLLDDLTGTNQDLQVQSIAHGVVRLEQLYPEYGAGTGKSSLAAQFVATAALRGQGSALFIFDESVHTLVSRSAELGADLRKHMEDGLVTIQQVDPAELSPGEFADAIRRAVESRKASIVVIDSLNGYLNAMPGERFLVNQLHEIFTYLGHAGVATLLIGAHQGLIGSQMITPVDASYLADAVILMRYYESKGEVRQAIAVVKKRGGVHERSIRDFRLEAGRIRVGEPLREFRGVLTGVPMFDGDPQHERKTS